MVKLAQSLDGTEPAGKAVALLVKTQGARLYSLAMRFCGNRQEAEDIVQETFLKAYAKWSQFEGRSSAATWLYTIATRLCQRQHRKRAGEPVRLESLDELLPFGESRISVVPDEGDGPLALQVRAESLRELEAAIVKLPIKFRMPLVLKEIVGLRVSEVAQVLGLKEATVKTRVHRARLRLRKAIERALPTKEVPEPIYSRQVCLDLLQAKQETLDRGVEFEFPDQVLCERCAEVFATLDWTQAMCQEVVHSELPERLREKILAQVG